MEDPALTLLRVQLAYVVLGTVFLFFGLASCIVAAIRQRSEVRILIWLGVWSCMYGSSLLARTPVLVAVLPRPFQVGVPYLINAVRYLLVVAALLAWSELTLGKVRLFTRAMAGIGLAIALAGIGWSFWTGTGEAPLPWNNLLAACAAIVLAAVVLIPKLSVRFLILRNRILGAGTLLFVADVMYRNVSGALRVPSLSIPLVDELVFAAFLFSFAYVAVEKVFANERRLVAIESELEVARQIQSSILPSGNPEVENVRIAASYEPMTEVGGDFYQFIRKDQSRVGFLIADVTGHGIPAALIASMVKIAMQSAVSCANDPGEVMKRLNHILTGQLRGQFVSAAYLWIDMELAQGLYSAGGHPPLLCWRGGGLNRIESNGLLFGVHADADYPVREIQLKPGDRFLLYTDGVVEPENSKGEAFGDAKLEQVFREHQSLPAFDFSEQLLSEIRRFQPASMTQQDDITLIVIDIV